MALLERNDPLDHGIDDTFGRAARLLCVLACAECRSGHRGVDALLPERRTARLRSAKCEGKWLDDWIKERDLPAAAGDRVQLQQVTMNLLLNAADAMSTVSDRARDVLISTRFDDDDCVHVSVTDAGVGLGPQGADRIFDPFYTTKPLGMGIGLSVSRSIVESHRGRLSATSNDGPGATFEFCIPRTFEDAPSAPNRGAATPRAGAAAS